MTHLIFHAGTTVFYNIHMIFLCKFDFCQIFVAPLDLTLYSNPSRALLGIHEYLGIYIDDR